jgi:ATP phosphoribosyltransferase regulatory subunit
VSPKTNAAGKARRLDDAPASSTPLARGGGALVSPKGMGDLLPPDAAARRALSSSVLSCFELCGYELVTPPVFEHA